MKLLEAKHLEKLNACKSQVELFKRRFPEGLNSKEVTVEDCKGFDINWVDRKLLDQSALAECDKIRDSALAEYGKICGSALAEYKKIRDSAFKIRGSAWAEYDKIRGSALAEYDKICNSAYAEYEKIRVSVLIKVINRFGWKEVEL